MQVNVNILRNLLHFLCFFSIWSSLSHNYLSFTPNRTGHIYTKASVKFIVLCAEEPNLIVLSQYFSLLSYLVYWRTVTWVFLKFPVIFFHPWKERLGNFQTNAGNDSPMKNQNVCRNTETVQTRYVFLRQRWKIVFKSMKAKIKLLTSLCYSYTSCKSHVL